MRRLLLPLLLIIALAEAFWIARPTLQAKLFPPRSHPAVRGYELARELGCFSCHGPEGLGGFDNPGSLNKVVPALAGGEMMMWADNEDELREWILYGRVLEDEVDFERTGLSAGQGSDRAVVMPAYEPLLADRDLDHLVAYLQAISGLQFPDDGDVQNGLELAHELGCFRCHGPMGIGGVANPSSLKGYVPGFFGQDYVELVESRDELREWIVDGAPKRLSGHPVASRIMTRQALKMPAYGEFLEPEQIDQLVAMVEWLASDAWREMPVP